jgi:MFS family permease
MALADALPAFILGSVLYGMSAFVSGPLSGYVTAARGNWSVARALTLIGTGFNGGAILGPVLGGYVGEEMGLRFSFLVAGCLFMISTVFVFRIEQQPVEIVTPAEKKDRWLELRARAFISLSP